MPTGLNMSSNEEEFEILRLKLLRLRWKRPRIQQHGKRGERQHDVDLLGTSGQTPLVAAQCKRHEPHKTIPPQEIEDEVTQAIALRPAVNHYAILTTARVSAQAQRKIVELNRRHKSSGLFTVELLHWRDIEQMLQEFPDLRDELYGGISASQVARVQQELSDLLGEELLNLAKKPERRPEFAADLPRFQAEGVERLQPLWHWINSQVGSLRTKRFRFLRNHSAIIAALLAGQLFNFRFTAHDQVSVSMRMEHWINQRAAGLYEAVALEWRRLRFRKDTEFQGRGFAAWWRK
jgi:hypothetical protein